jgi:hypothetical protein
MRVICHRWIFAESAREEGRWRGYGCLEELGVLGELQYWFKVNCGRQFGYCLMRCLQLRMYGLK